MDTLPQTEMHSTGPTRAIISLAALTLYISACALPAVYFDEGGHACTAIRLGSPTGFVALLLGWIPPGTVPWSANLLLLVGLIAFWRRSDSWAAGLGGLAAALALTTALFVPRVLLGYYLWQGALIVFTTGAALLALRNRRREPQTIG